MAKKISYKGKAKGELLKELAQMRTELRTARFAAAGARPKDTNHLAKTRRQVARILTELDAQAKVAK